MNYPAHPNHLTHPTLPRPTCKVMLVCGPPAVGKSTFVKQHAKPGDIVIDLDAIAAEHGIGRSRRAGDLERILADRNRRLAALASEQPERIAWVIVAAPGHSQREWWREALAADVIFLQAEPRELRRRALADPTRDNRLSLKLIDKWLFQEKLDEQRRAALNVNVTPWEPAL